MVVVAIRPRVNCEDRRLVKRRRIKCAGGVRLMVAVKSTGQSGRSPGSSARIALRKSSFSPSQLDSTVGKVRQPPGATAR